MINNKKKILRLILVINHSTSPYNSFSLPENKNQDISILTFYDSEIETPDHLNIFSSSGSIKKYFRVLYNLLCLNTYDIIHVHNFYSGFVLFLVNVLIKKSILAKTILTVHTSHSNLSFKHRLLSIFSFYYLNKIVFCSDSSLKSFPKFYSKIFEEKKIVIANGVDLKRIKNINLESQKKNKTFRIISVGRLIEIKNHKFLIDAFYKLKPLIKNSRLVIIGEGPLKHKLTNYVDSIGLNRDVEFLGALNRDEVYEELIASDLFISCSTVEGLPVSVLESIACGTPAIISAIAPHIEIANNLKFVKNFYLWKKDDLVNKIIKSYDEKALIIKNKNIMFEEVKNKFSLELMLKKYDEVYNSMISKNNLEGNYNDF